MATDKDVETSIKKALKGAKDRDGGRRRRAKPPVEVNGVVVTSSDTE